MWQIIEIMLGQLTNRFLTIWSCNLAIKLKKLINFFRSRLHIRFDWRIFCGNAITNFCSNFFFANLTNSIHKIDHLPRRIATINFPITADNFFFFFFCNQLTKINFWLIWWLQRHFNQSNQKLLSYVKVEISTKLRWILIYFKATCF